MADRVVATDPPSRTVRVVTDSGMALASVEIPSASHAWWSGAFVRHPYTGIYLARVRHRRNQPITQEHIHPTDPAGEMLS